MSGNDAAETAKIEVWWDMNDCTIPEGYDARRVRSGIERAFEKLGYTGRVSITAYGDQKKTPCDVLRGLSSTGVAVAHTNSDSTRSVMHRDMVEWRAQNPPPGIILIISDQVEGEFSWDLARLQQRTRYKLFQANSMKSLDDFILLYKANWRWEQLLEKGDPPLVAVVGGLSSAAMFYCKSCNFDCQSLKKFRKHLSSYKHGMEEAINPPDTRLSCVTKRWARNYPATPEHATAKIHVLWDMNDCPIPEGYDARRVRPSIERAFKEIGYSGPVSITAFADQKQTPVHHLLALSSTGVDFSHTLPWVHYSRMITDFEKWTKNNPAPASIMIISDEVASSKYRSTYICGKLQESNYNCFLAYSVRPFEMPVLVTSAEWLWDSLLSGSCFLFVLSCVTKTWARNYPATPEHATAKIHVLWDMNDCPIPEGYDACCVRPSIERAFKELGYTGPVSITAFADQKQTPDHHLLALSSTGVDFSHTLPWVHYSRMITDFEKWTKNNPAPASIMIISDEVASSQYLSSLICRKLQKSNYNCFLAYSVRPFEKPILVWDSLLAVSETKRNILHKCSESESERVVAASTGMFCCTLCLCDCKSLDDFNKHLSSKDHTQEEKRMTSHAQSFPHRQRQYKISNYYDEVGYPPKTKRMRKAALKGFFLPRPLRFTRR
uniref:NYN domain-containing protein n=1 Tax=Brassica oleracea var. oleracea TaxID=109376 RepID=A0A0D3DER1_BRAOL